MSSLLSKKRIVAHNLCQLACKILCAIFNSGTAIAEQWFQEKKERERNEKKRENLVFEILSTGIQFQYTLPLCFVETGCC
jgi:hypothetical protein